MTRPSAPNRTAVASDARLLRSGSPLYDLIVGTAGLVAFWPLDDPPGSTTAREVVAGRTAAFGSSGRTNAGYSSPGYLPGSVEGIDGKVACYFSGGYAQAAFDSAFNPAGSFSLECWYTAPGTDFLLGRNSYTHLASHRSDFSTAVSYSLTLTNFFVTGASPPRTYVARGADFFGNNLGSVAFTNTTTPPAAEWHHLALTFDTATRVASLYLDGAAAGGSTLPAGNTQARASTAPFRLAWASTNVSNHYPMVGALQYVSFYDRVLSAAEIRQRGALGLSLTSLYRSVSYQAALHALVPSTTNLYPGTERSGTTLADVIGSQYGELKAGAQSGVDGLLGPAPSFDGTAGRADLAVAYPAGQLPTTLTVQGWVRPTDVGGAEAAIVARGDEGASQLNYRFGKAAGDGRLSLVVKLDATTYSYVTTSAALQANAWSHVAAVIQGGQAPVIVVDGVQANLSSGAAIPAATLQSAPNASVVRVAASENTPAKFWPGQISHLSIARAAAPVAQLSELHAVGLRAAGRLGA